eukprot:GAHX01000945.1.p1 GENE.GAHX01000945.1~~GAHX01000945.1.p1  ORF type:complete len:454 (-),score=67.96 GAHX01000945.1:61-1422(-)
MSSTPLLEDGSVSCSIKSTPSAAVSDKNLETISGNKYTKHQAQIDKLNWFCFFLFGHGVYFNENWYSVWAPDFIGTSWTSIMVLFLHLPKFIFKILSVYFIHKFSTRTKVYGFTIFSILSSVLIMIFFPLSKIDDIESGDRGRLIGVRILMVVASAFSCMSMALGEITLLGYSKQFQRTCVNGWSSGSGFAGFTAGIIQWLLKHLLRSFDKTTHFKYCMAANAMVMFTVPIAYFFILVKPEKQMEEEVSKDLEKLKKKSLLGKLKVLFGNLKAYSVPLLIGYFIYFVCFTGLIPFVKEYNKANDKFEALKLYPDINSEEYKKKATASADFFTYAFIILRFGVFVCRSLPQFIKFYKVYLIPIVHIISLAGLLAICLTDCKKVLTIIDLIPLGFGHGAVVGYSNLGLRDKAPKSLKEFGLSYINIASALGATIGCSVAFGVNGLFMKYKKVPGS